jgi:hypothetical protein
MNEKYDEFGGFGPSNCYIFSFSAKKDVVDASVPFGQDGHLVAPCKRK